MTQSEWLTQGQIIGSTFSEKDYHEMTTNITDPVVYAHEVTPEGATSNPGTVQAHIDRAFAEAKRAYAPTNLAMWLTRDKKDLIVGIDYETHEVFLHSGEIVAGNRLVNFHDQESIAEFIEHENMVHADGWSE